MCLPHSFLVTYVPCAVAFSLNGLSLCHHVSHLIISLIPLLTDILFERKYLYPSVVQGSSHLFSQHFHISLIQLCCIRQALYVHLMGIESSWLKKCILHQSLLPLTNVYLGPLFLQHLAKFLVFSRVKK